MVARSGFSPRPTVVSDFDCCRPEGRHARDCHDSQLSEVTTMPSPLEVALREALLKLPVQDGAVACHRRLELMVNGQSGRIPMPGSVARPVATASAPARWLKSVSRAAVSAATKAGETGMVTPQVVGTLSCDR